MEKEFVTYEQALALEELGFDEECMAHCMGYGKGEIENGTYKIEHTQIFYPNDWITPDDVAENLNLHCFHMCKIPLKQQVFRWFRDKHEWYANLSSWLHEEEIGTYHEFEIYGANQYAHGSVPFKTYEEAENACIDKLIEISKEQQ
jgi:hypothetical protein